jgi:hypothetical protein
LNIKFTVGNESVCIDIFINNSKHLSPELSLFYDCSWYNEAIEGRYVLLEYMAKGEDYKEARKFSFITPATNKLGKNTIYNYILQELTCHSTIESGLSLHKRGKGNNT